MNENTNHLLCLAEVDVLLVPLARLGVLDVHQPDEGHGAPSQQQDGEEHDDDGGGADELPLLDGLQPQVEAEGVGDGPTQPWGTENSKGQSPPERPQSSMQLCISQRIVTTPWRSH